MSQGTGKRSFVAGVTSFLGALVPGFRRYLPEQLDIKSFREEYVANHVRRGVAYQIRAMREGRKMKQGDLAKILGKPQSNIARLENPNYGSFSLQTLLEIANGFDVWLSVQFVPFSEGLRRTEVLTPEALNAESFTDEREAGLLSHHPNSFVTTVNNVVVGAVVGAAVGELYRFSSAAQPETTTGIVVRDAVAPQTTTPHTAQGYISVRDLPRLQGSGANVWH